MKNGRHEGQESEPFVRKKKSLSQRLRENWMSLSILGAVFVAGGGAATSFVTKADFREHVVETERAEDRVTSRIDVLQEKTSAAEKDAQIALRGIRQMRDENRKHQRWVQDVLIRLARETGVRGTPPLPKLEPIENSD